MLSFCSSPDTLGCAVCDFAGRGWTSFPLGFPSSPSCTHFLNNSVSSWQHSLCLEQLVPLEAIITLTLINKCFSCSSFHPPEKSYLTTEIALADPMDSSGHNSNASLQFKETFEGRGGKEGLGTVLCLPHLPSLFSKSQEHCLQGPHWTGSELTQTFFLKKPVHFTPEITFELRNI